MANPIPPAKLSRLSVLLATGFGSGLFPRAPGTAGSLLALLLFAFVNTQTMGYLLFLALALLAGVWICERATAEIGEHDHPGIVWDEFVGMWLTLAWVPVNYLSLLLGFALFRLFDIWKPWPIGLLDKQVSGGLGIMLDDVLAGVFAWGCLQLLMWAFMTY